MEGLVPGRGTDALNGTERAGKAKGQPDCSDGGAGGRISGASPPASPTSPSRYHKLQEGTWMSTGRG